jgi:hypothetical protein
MKAIRSTIALLAISLAGLAANVNSYLDSDKEPVTLATALL